MQNTTIEEYKYASLNRRALAFTIDCIILVTIMTPVSNLLTNMFLKKDFAQSTINSLKNTEGLEYIALISKSLYTNWTYILIQLFLLIIVFSYFFICWKKLGASIGKYILKCKIVDATTYNNIDNTQIILRMLGNCLNILTLGIGFFLVDFSKRKQGLHDKISHTVVIIKK